MFELRCFVDDKKLPEVLRLLDGLVYQPIPIPVRDAVAKQGKVVSTVAQKDDAATAVFKILYRSFQTGRFRPKDIRSACKAAGQSPASYSYFTNKLVEARKLKRLRTGQYTLIGVK